MSEEGVRQALARLGRGASPDPAEERSPDQGREPLDPFRQSGGNHHGGHTIGQNGSQRRTSAAPMHKLKRPAFVQDGDVVVEYAGRDRPGHHDGGDQGRSALDALRDEVVRERRVREEAERALTETRLALQGLQTRLAHLELDLNESRSAARAAQDEAALLLAGRAHGSTTGASPTAALAIEPATTPLDTIAQSERQAAEREAPERQAPERQAAGRVPKVRRQQATPRVSLREPKPVKWWIKSKG
nr:hypothetical protein [uncultured Lichenicoccus sp.]